MQPARFRQEDLLLVEINNAKFTRPAVSSGEERGLLSRTAAGNRAYFTTGSFFPFRIPSMLPKNHFMNVKLSKDFSLQSNSRPG